MEFDFDYRPGAIAFGRGRVGDLASAVASAGGERALVVAGETTGTTEAVVGPVREGLGDRHAGTFAGTTPDKRVSEAVAAAERAREVDADALVALGGGSSLDVATVARVLLAREKLGDPAAELRETGTLSLADGDLPAIVAVPTTLAGADLSVVAGITTEGESGTVHGGVYDTRLMPDHLTYDPALFETTPLSVLRGSAMNGFDKAVETPYAAIATPVTDATSERALRLFRRSLPRLDGDGLDEAVAATVLAQYGCSRGDGLTLSILHAFGHALSRGYDLQQGAAHAVVAPEALAYLFEATDGRRELLARGLGVETDDKGPDAVARGVVRAVEDVRDALGLPTRLRETPVPREDLPEVAERTLADSFASNAADFEPTREGLLGVLEAAW